MSNYQNNCNLSLYLIERKNVQNGTEWISDILSRDSDFSENSEYYRKDTKGNEADRCAVEIFNKHNGERDLRKRLDAILNEVVAYSYEGEQGTVTFIIGNDGHSGDYEIEVKEAWDMYIVAIAYVG